MTRFPTPADWTEVLNARVRVRLGLTRRTQDLLHMKGLTEASVLERRHQRDRALWHSIASGAGVRVVTLALSLLTVAISVRSLGDTAFGVVATLGTMIGLTGFADLGLGLGLMTRLAQSLGEDDQASLKPLISSALASLSVLGVFVGVVGSGSIYILPWDVLLGSPPLPNSVINASVVIFAVSVGLAIPASIGQRVLFGTQQGSAANTWSLAASIAQLGAVIAAAWLDAPVWAFVGATISIPVLVSCVQTVWVFNRASHLRPERSHVSRDVVSNLLRVSGLFFALNLAVAAGYQSDTLITSAVLGASSAAVFAIALRMFGAASGLFATSLQQFWPALAEALARGDLEWTRHRFKQVLIFSTLLLATAAGALVAFGQPVARIWVGEGLVPPLSLLVAFAVWTVYSHVMSQCSILLNAGGVLAPQVGMAAAMVCVNVPLSIMLTRQIGLAGPLIGSLVAHMLCEGVLTAFLVRRLLRDGVRGSTLAAPRHTDGQ
jgi:O-antigen/teichoic acid export membrane protein